MRTRISFPVVAVLLGVFTVNPNLHAQPLVNIETVMVGDAGNAADTTGYGAVGDVFNIGKYEVTISQYTTFLNSVASVTSDSYIVDLWNVNMMDDNPSIAGISRSGAGTIADPYVYAEIGPFGLTPPGASSAGNRPISYVSWFDAARFANWMNNGATNGASTETGAYALNGATTGIITKNAGATWWIPSEDEWYKASYYKGGGTNAGYWLYPTQSDTAPANTIGGATNQANYNNGVYSVTQAGTPEPSKNYLTDVGAFSNSASAYDTYDQGGNVFEWNDAVLGDSARGFRGGSWYTDDFNLQSSGPAGSDPLLEFSFVGFRLATVPEPSTYALLIMTGAGALWWARRRR
jgi:formylglycine-generating enzyme required for sulfatase activity